MIELTGTNLKEKYLIPWQQRGKSYRAKERTSPAKPKGGMDNATLRLIKEERERQRKAQSHIAVSLNLIPTASGRGMRRHFDRKYK